MSFDEQNLEAFIELISDKRSRLFTPQDIASLTKLIDSIPDDIEKLSSAIAAWYEKRPKILDAQLDLLNNFSSNRTSFALNSSDSDRQVSKQVLQNAIQKNFPSGTSRPELNNK